MIETKIEEYFMLIDGEKAGATSGEFFEAVNPATEEVIAKVPKGGKEDSRRAIDAASVALVK